MPGGADSDVLSEFLGEADELIGALEESFTDLQRRPADAEPIGRAFRLLHTLKGNAALLGLTPVVGLTHAAENALSAMRVRAGELDGAGVNLLRELIDALRGQTGRLRPPGAVGAPAEPRPVEAEAGPAPSAPERSAGPHAGVRRTPLGPLRVEIDRVERLEALAADLEGRRRDVETLLGRVRAGTPVDGATARALAGAGADLARVSDELSAAVRRARLQPLDRAFGRYRRLVRDLALRTGKPMRLVVDTEGLEVDVGTLGVLREAMVHLVRNAADHGIESPDERRAVAKPEIGTIALRAARAERAIRVVVTDDGRGLSRDRLLRAAIERGITTPERAPDLADSEVFRFILIAGFSTADQVSDLSGRGIGMDVVRTCIERLGGTVGIDSRPHLGTTVTLTIPAPPEA